MQTVIIVVHLMIVSVLIGAVLLQKSEGGGLGMGGGGGGFMSSRGTANLLTRTTAILAGLFFLTSMALAWIAGIDRKPASILGAPATQSQPGSATPVAPPTSGGVLDTLKKVDEQQAPAGPQAPRSQ